jgi:hypothetical protein
VAYPGFGWHKSSLHFQEIAIPRKGQFQAIFVFLDEVASERDHLGHEHDQDLINAVVVTQSEPNLQPRDPLNW